MPTRSRTESGLRSASLPAFDSQTRQPSRRPLSGVRPCAPVSRDRQEANAPSVPATQRLLAVPKFAIPKRPRSKSTWMSSFQPIRSPHRPANSMFHSDVSASGLKNSVEIDVRHGVRQMFRLYGDTYFRSRAWRTSLANAGLQISSRSRIAAAICSISPPAAPFSSKWVRHWRTSPQICFISARA